MISDTDKVIILIALVVLILGIAVLVDGVARHYKIAKSMRSYDDARDCDKTSVVEDHSKETRREDR